MKGKKDIRSISFNEIEDFFKNNEKSFRAKQVEEWLWKKCVHSFDEMTNLPKAIRQNLINNFVIHPLKPMKVLQSKDGTIKTVFQLFDEEIIEGVLIPSNSRMTACISTQVGCSLNCKFCATGKLKFKRNLTSGEIFDQVVILNNQAFEKFNKHLTNIVLMGMGEPLLNYNNVLKALKKITSEQGLGFSAGRITLSTAGISKMIEKLGDDKVKFNLAVSLNTVDDNKRTSIMPVNKSNDLASLAKAVKYFYTQTKCRVTFEYLLLNGFNDSISDAALLVDFCRGLPCKVNIIEYNPIKKLRFKKSFPETTDKFVNFLGNKNIIVNVRRSSGKDIMAACGQLAGKI